MPVSRAPLSRLAVDRAISELRRSRPVVIGPTAGKALMVISVEGVSDNGLLQITEISGSKPELMITGKRAEILKISQAQNNAVSLTPSVTINSQWIRAVTDPLNGQHLTLQKADFKCQIQTQFDGRSAAVLLNKHARLLPAAVVTEINIPDNDDIHLWALRHDILIVDAGDIFQYLNTTSQSLKLVSQARVPIEGAVDTYVKAFRPMDGGLEHLAIIIGQPDPAKPVLMRVHSECFTGDLLGSLRCDCGDQLQGAIHEISKNGSGILLYLAQEGRGIGLVNKLRAYELQDQGFDTIDANEQLGFDADERIYLPAARMLELMGFKRVRLLTNNPIKVDALSECGVDVVERVPHHFPANKHNETYLKTKAARSGHLI